MLSNPEFPPLLTGHAVLAQDDPLRMAMDGAARGELGAGDILWSLAETHARAAIVLEPDCSLAKALHMVPVLMVAIGDALGAIGPPNLAFMYHWPNILLANSGIVGDVFLAVPEQTALDAVPASIVLGFSLALALPDEEMGAPGVNPEMTALFEEGCGDLDRTQIIEAISRHFLAWVDTWEHDGFAAVHADYWGRMAPQNGPVTIKTGQSFHMGEMLGIDENGGLLLKNNDNVRGVSLAEGLGLVGD